MAHHSISRSWQVSPTRAPLEGEVSVPGDKSISHRALMFSAFGHGDVRIGGLLRGEDVLSTWKAMSALGVGIVDGSDDVVTVHGRGFEAWREPGDVIDLGNSGTSMRLMTGLFAGTPGMFTVLTGDPYLRRRPMGRVVEPLRSMGASIDGRDGGKLAPLAIRGRALEGGQFDLNIASAQVLSCLALAGLRAQSQVTVTLPGPARDHTQRMLKAMGANIEGDERSLTLNPGATLRNPETIAVPGDFSSAAFFMAAATLVPGSDLTLIGVGVNPTRTGFLDLLRAMGGKIELLNRRDEAGEPVADLRIRHAQLRGIEVPPEAVPLAIDEFPMLFALAAAAEGVTTVRGAEELRVKESDRIAAMAKGLRHLGIQVEELPDGAIIHGGHPSGGTVDSHGDHRIAMSFAVLAQVARGAVTIRDVANVATSFPSFEGLLRAVGGHLEGFDE